MNLIDTDMIQKQIELYIAQLYDTEKYEMACACYKVLDIVRNAEIVHGGTEISIGEHIIERLRGLGGIDLADITNLKIGDIKTEFNGPHFTNRIIVPLELTVSKLGGGL